jgi:hypothetical protein
MDKNTSIRTEKDSYKAWQRGELALFISSINLFSRTNDECIGGEDTASYNLDEAMSAISEYFMNVSLSKLHKDAYSIYEIREIHIPLPERQSYPSIQSIFDLFDFLSITPLFSQKITEGNNVLNPVLV